MIASNLSVGGSKTASRGARTIEDERNDGTPARERINYQATRRRGETVSYLRVTDGTRQLRKGIEVNSPHTFHDGVSSSRVFVYSCPRANGASDGTSS